MGECRGRQNRTVLTPRHLHNTGCIWRGYLKRTITCFALACCVQVVVGAKQLALAIGSTVINAWRQVRAQVDFRRHVAAHLKPSKTNVCQ